MHIEDLWERLQRSGQSSISCTVPYISSSYNICTKVHCKESFCTVLVDKTTPDYPYCSWECKDWDERIRAA